ncbi:MAG: hypothetical protein Q9183_003365 [Haloplaca sp. 2 TL-2023]
MADLQDSLAGNGSQDDISQAPQSKRPRRMRAEPLRQELATPMAQKTAKQRKSIFVKRDVSLSHGSIDESRETAAVIYNEWDGSTPSETSDSEVFGGMDPSGGSGEASSSKPSNGRETARPRFMCPHCNDNPDGFTMQHNLKLHIAKYHLEKRRVWCCRENSQAGEIIPRFKSCVLCAGGKKWFECASAATHLRKFHFNNSDTGKGKLNNAKNVRIRSNGGWPPMDYLKQFLEESEENTPAKQKGPRKRKIDFLSKSRD